MAHLPIKNPLRGFYWFPLGILAIALGHGSPAQAKEPAISFELASDPDMSASTSANEIANGVANEVEGDESYHQVQPLQIPDKAKQVPRGRSDDAAPLPPPPQPALTATVVAASVAPAFIAPVSVIPATEAIAPQSAPSLAPQAQILQFGLTQSQPMPLQPVSAEKPMEESVNQLDAELNPARGDIAVDRLFEGGSNSLVARAVGSAEGTRTPAGDRTPAYYGHVDPGNGVWNLGSFSYQHGAKSPDDADRKQLRRLQQQARVLQTKAADRGLHLSLEEQLNGIDLANQAPRAALDQGGYIDWLYQARSIGLQGSDAVLWARTRSFLDPDTQRWNAPGLGNTLQTISHDQERRQRAIASAIVAYQQSSPANQIAESSVQDGAIAHRLQNASHAAPAKSWTEHLTSEMGAIAQIISLDL